ncbi:MAG: hypothetical protein ACTSXH_18185 [Promethearchaeota archaeon]
MPKDKFNQLKERFKENGGKIIKGADSWRWILPVSCEKKLRKKIEDRSMLASFF